MARFGVNDADNYGGSGGKFFSLKNNGDTANVRFMYDTIDDVQGTAVHEVEIDGRRVMVDCLREYHQPVTDCPFCAAKIAQKAKLFISVYNIDDDACQVWERGAKTYMQKLSSLCARHGAPLYATPFEIERQGKPGDNRTDYTFYNNPADDTRLEDLPEPLDIYEEGIVLKKTPEEMEYFLDHGKFPEAKGGRAGGRSTGRDPATDRRPAREVSHAPRGRQTPAGRPAATREQSERSSGDRGTAGGARKARF